MTLALTHVIDGRPDEGTSGVRADSVDPWSQEAWATYPLADRDDVGRAVRAARRAFDDGWWGSAPASERRVVLDRFADLIDADLEPLALRDTSDVGKLLRNAREVDVPKAADHLRFYAEHATLSTASVFPGSPRFHTYERFEPAGVVASIAPWNFPIQLACWQIAPALAWGNTVVLKPAEQSPASATRLAELAIEAGMPPGVLNVVHGGGPDSAGQFLVEAGGTDRIVFTGESRTGRTIAATAGARLVPASMELGGKGANLVFADADLDEAVEWSARAIFNNAGQACLCGSRIYVERVVHDEFVARFAAHADTLRVGDPRDPDTDVGPLASGEQFAKVCSYLEVAERDGGRVVAGGDVDAWTVRPTVVTDLPSSSRLWREEVFGPLVPVAPFDGEDEAVALANDTEYGLSADVFTRDLGRAHRVAARLSAGTVWVNCHAVRERRAPFGGRGISGVGRQGGDHSRNFFTEPKTVTMRLP